MKLLLMFCMIMIAKIAKSGMEIFAYQPKSPLSVLRKLRNFGVRHQEDKSHVLRRQGIMWLPVKLEDFSRSPSNSAVSHIKQVATQERYNTSAREVLLRPFLNNGYRLRKAAMSQFFFTL